MGATTLTEASESGPPVAVRSSEGFGLTRLPLSSGLAAAKIFEAEAARAWARSRAAKRRSDEQFLLAGAAAAYERVAQMILGETMTTDPVQYTVTVLHWQDGDIDVTVSDVGSSETDRASVAHALRVAADKVESGTPVSLTALS